MPIKEELEALITGYEKASARYLKDARDDRYQPDIQQGFYMAEQKLDCVVSDLRRIIKDAD